MKKGRLPEDLVAFVVAHIESVHTLEILLLLSNERTRAWTDQDIHAQVKSSVGAVRKTLATLVRTGLATVVGPDQQSFQYAPRSPALDRLTAKLAVAYSERSTAVVELIYSHPIRVAQSFSNAFDFRKKFDP